MGLKFVTATRGVAVTGLAAAISDASGEHLVARPEFIFKVRRPCTEGW